MEEGRGGADGAPLRLGLGLRRCRCWGGVGGERGDEACEGGIEVEDFWVQVRDGADDVLLVLVLWVGRAEEDSESGRGAGDAHAGWGVAVGAVAVRELGVAGGGGAGVVVIGYADGDGFGTQPEDAVCDVLAEVAGAGVVVGWFVVESDGVSVAGYDGFGVGLGVGRGWLVVVVRLCCPSFVPGFGCLIYLLKGTRVAGLAAVGARGFFGLVFERAPSLPLST